MSVIPPPVCVNYAWKITAQNALALLKSTEVLPPASSRATFSPTVSRATSHMSPFTSSSREFTARPAVTI